MRLYKSLPSVSDLDLPSPILYEGERLCLTLARALMNGAPIDATSQPFYDDDDVIDSDDFVVDPATDIRTDRFSLAEAALFEHPRSVASSMTDSADSSVVTSPSDVSDSQSVDFSSESSDSVS